jgi:hypothetical protein
MTCFYNYPIIYITNWFTCSFLSLSFIIHFRIVVVFGFIIYYCSTYPKFNCICHRGRQQSSHADFREQLGPALGLSTLGCSGTHNNRLQVLENYWAPHLPRHALTIPVYNRGLDHFVWWLLPAPECFQKPLKIIWLILYMQHREVNNDTVCYDCMSDEAATEWAVIYL